MKRVIILGAGVGGIDLARRINPAKYKVTLLEQNSEVGGKVWTFEDKDGTPHEMGACFQTVEYRALKALNDLLPKRKRVTFVGLGNEKSWRDIQDPDLQLEFERADDIESKSVSRKVYDGYDEVDPAELLTNYPDKAYINSHFSDWLVLSKPYTLSTWLERKSHVIKPALKGRLVPDFFQSTALIKAFSKYREVYESLIQEEPIIMPNKPSEKSDMYLPFIKFIHKHKLEAMIPLFMIATTAMGYGFLESIPTFYGLWWFRGLLTTAYSKQKFGGPTFTTMIPEGFQELLRRVVSHFKLNVKYNTRVTRVTKTDKRWEIQTTKGTFIADQVIVNIPLKQFVRLLRGSNKPILTEYVKHLKHFRLQTTLIEHDRPSKDDAPVTYFIPGLQKEFRGHLYAYRDSAKSVRWNKAAKLPSRGVCYQMCEHDTSHNKLLDVLKSDLAKWDVKEAKILAYQQWNYFPHFDIEGLKQGWPWKIMDLQGNDGMFFVGSSVCFESVDYIIRYNDLVHKRFTFTAPN